MTDRNFGEMSERLAEEITDESNVNTKKRVVNSSFQFFNISCKSNVNVVLVGIFFLLQLLPTTIRIQDYIEIPL